MLPSISIEPFRGDYQALEKMALSSWRDEYPDASFPNLYQPEYLKFLCEPVKDKRHLITAYQGEEPVSFFANLPRRYCYQGKIYQGVLSCLLVSKKELFRQGLAVHIINEALKLNQIYHYDLALLYLEPGHRSTRMINKLRQAGHRIVQLKKMYVVARALDLKQVAEGEGLKRWEKALVKILRAHQIPEETRAPVRKYHPSDLEQCLFLLNQYQNKVPLARVWSREELAWELEYPEISETLVYEKKDKIQGLINWTYHFHLGKIKTKWAWLNHIAYPELSFSEQISFIKTLLHYLKTKDCVGVIEWTKNYYPMAPLYRTHFFPYFRAVNLLAWVFNPKLNLQKLPRIYEVQI